MYEMTVEGLKYVVNSHYSRYFANYLVLWISVNGATPEMIINPRENFEAKLKYIETAYNNDLTLKTNENIVITRYNVVKELSELD